MTIDMAGRVSSKVDEIALQEATAASLKSMEHLVDLASQKEAQVVSARLTSTIIVPLKRAILAGSTRTGHALFRRAPIQTSTNQIPPSTPPSIPPLSGPLTLDFNKGEIVVPTNVTNLSSTSTTSSFSFFPMINDNVTVSKNDIDKLNAALIAPPKQPESFADKPPLPVKRSREVYQSGGVFGKNSVAAAKCHCNIFEKRICMQHRIKRSIRVEAPFTNPADIPADEYNWRKYGQKPIKGSRFPRGYYKCSSVQGCPAKKHVERAIDDPKFLIVTYRDEHNHAQEVKQGAVMHHFF